MTDHEFVSSHGSVAEEVAALVEAIRAGSSKSREGRSQSRRPEHVEDGECTCAGDLTGIDTCQICPVCRAIAALHTISPTAVNALADLAHQAEVTLRALAADLRRQQGEPAAPAREDIPVTDLDED